MNGVSPVTMHSRPEMFGRCSIRAPFTEALKDGDLDELQKHTEALHGLLDIAVVLS